MRASRPRWQRPAALSFLLGLAYLLLCSFYIWFSSKLASTLAPDLAAMYRIELAKGFAFVTLSTGGFVSFVYLLLRRVAKTESALHEHREVLDMYHQSAGAGLLASTIAHDINNMLMVLQARALKLGDHPGYSADQQIELVELQKHVDDLISLAQSLQNSARASTPTELREIDLTAVLTESVRIAKQHPRAKSAEIEIEAPETMIAPGNPIVLNQVMLNLLLNAVDAVSTIKGKGKITVTLESDPAARQVILQICDNGPGIPEKEREIIFSPYYTTKSTGTGLGLLSVKAGVKAHHGSISVQASDLGGACFRVVLPL